MPVFIDENTGISSQCPLKFAIIDCNSTTAVRLVKLTKTTRIVWEDGKVVKKRVH